MFGVVDGLVDECGDVIVEERVDDVAPMALAVDQSHGAQQPELVRDGGLLELHGFDEVADRPRTIPKGRQDQ